MRLRKSLLAKAFVFICAFCCVFFLTFGLTGCSEGKDGLGVKSTQINDKGELIIVYTDGTETNLGIIKGLDGSSGENGKSAYQLAVEKGYKGTEAEWLDTLKGANGKSAYELAVEKGYKGTEAEWLESLKGQSGEPGKNGEPGKDGKGIASVKFNDVGKLVITYTDGTSVTLDLPAVTQECEHEFESFVMQEATCSKQGVVLNVCVKDKKGCGDSFVEYLPIDPDNHNYETTVVAPTCTEDGYTTKKCLDCGHETEKSDIVEKLGHEYVAVTTQPTCTEAGFITYTCSRCHDTYVEEGSKENGLLASGHSEESEGVWLTVVDEGANICVDGGQRVLVCSKCYEHVFKAETIAATGHEITASWTVTKNPTLSEEGELSGFCEKCGTNATVKLPKLNDKDYRKTIVEGATCTNNGLDKYEITLGNWNGEFKVVTSTMHRRQGLEMSLDGKYTAEQVDAVFGNTPATCLDESGKGYFVCDDCGQKYLVTVIGDHQYTEEDLIVEVPSTCTEHGYKEYKCPVCEKTVKVSLALAPHTYGEPKVDIKKAEGEKDIVTLTFTCEVCQREEVIVCDSYETVRVEATCKAKGSITYNYTYTDGNGEPQSGTFALEIPMIKHSYNGYEFGYDADLDEKVFEIKYVEETFGNSLADCLTEGYGSFTCATCGEKYLVKIKGNHNFELKETVAPTCTEAGYFLDECTVCHETQTRPNPDAPATGHHFVLNGQPVESEENGKKVITLNFVCDKCDAEQQIKASEYKYETVASTCETEGGKYIIYTYTDPAGELHENERFLMEVLPKSGHHNAKGKEIDLSKVYTIDDIDEVFGNTPATCLEEGKGYFTCPDCGKKFLIDVIGNHTWGDEITVQPTCTEKGYTHRVCEVCGEDEVVAGSEVNALGHDYEKEVVKAATMTEEGKLVVTCKRCGESTEYTLPALNSKDAYKVEIISEATCANEGLAKYTFVVKEKDGTVVYEYVVTVVTPVKEHSEGKEITWQYDGYDYTGYICEECNNVIVTAKKPIEETPSPEVVAKE